MSKFKIGLNEQAWESMRTPEEIAQDEDREAHMDGYCQGAPACWLCQDEQDRIKEINQKALAKLEPLREALKTLDVNQINIAFNVMTRK